MPLLRGQPWPPRWLRAPRPPASGVLPCASPFRLAPSWRPPAAWRTSGQRVCPPPRQAAVRARSWNYLIRRRPVPYDPDNSAGKRADEGLALSEVKGIVDNYTELSRVLVHG